MNKNKVITSYNNAPFSFSFNVVDLVKLFRMLNSTNDETFSAKFEPKVLNLLRDLGFQIRDLNTAADQPLDPTTPVESGENGGGEEKSNDTNSVSERPEAGLDTPRKIEQTAPYSDTPVDAIRDSHAKSERVRKKKNDAIRKKREAVLKSPRVNFSSSIVDNYLAKMANPNVNEPKEGDNE